ncbi:MAG: ribokinase [Thermoflexales bacterium]|nr:ribokinase [Thermoflexales bacterium]MDW8351408.1 ribokinase [Anaerolineae bacterium]
MITVVGSLNMDLIIRVPRFPEPGEAIHGEDLRTACGGKGANQAYAVARMGQPAYMVGCVGADAFGEAMVENLKAVGVDTHGVIRRGDYPSGVAMILVHDATGQNEIIVAAGANRTLTADDVRSAADRLAQSDAVIAQLETSLAATEAAMAIARRAGRLSVLNPAPFAPLDEALLGSCDYLIPNENEAGRLVGVTVRDLRSAAEVAQALRARGARNVLVTLGENGVWVDAEAWRGHVPAFPVHAIDTVAAGDTFIGAFVTRLVEGAPVAEAARFGCAAAAIAVTRPGAQPSIPLREEVESFLRAHGQVS